MISHLEPENCSQHLIRQDLLVMLSATMGLWSSHPGTLYYAATQRNFQRDGLSLIPLSQ